MPITLHAQVKLDQQGPLVIPDELIQALSVKNGSSLMAKVENGRLILENRDSIRQRLKSRFANIPTDISLADELIADRRSEAYQDSGK